MRMPFGKYCGLPLTEVPDAYLDWLLSIRLLEPLLSAVNREAARREAYFGGSNGGYTGPARRAAGVDPAIAAELVTAGYQALALKHHPDRGGNLETMKKINVTAEALRELVADPKGSR